MPRTTRFHLDEAPDGGSVRHLTKEQFGRRLYNRMLDLGWNQSELARQAGLPRDSISTYVRGQSFPTPLSLKKLSDALGARPEELLPNSAESAIDRDNPAMEMKVSTADPTKAWLRVNRMVTLSNAAKIMQILSEDASGVDTGAVQKKAEALSDESMKRLQKLRDKLAHTGKGLGDINPDALQKYLDGEITDKQFRYHSGEITPEEAEAETLETLRRFDEALAEDEKAQNAADAK